jgi:hypothetical protein
MKELSVKGMKVVFVFLRQKNAEKATSAREKVLVEEGERGMERVPMILAHSHLGEY